MAKQYAEMVQEAPKKADGYINIKGVVPKGGSSEDAIGIKGQSRVMFPLDAENPLHAKLLEQASKSGEGTYTITLTAEVRNVEATPERDLSGVEF